MAPKSCVEFEGDLQSLICVSLDFHVREGAHYMLPPLKLAGMALAVMGLLLAFPLWYVLARRLLRGSPDLTRRFSQLSSLSNRQRAKLVSR